MEEKQYVTEWANENLGLTLKITKMLHEEHNLCCGHILLLK